MKRRIQPILQGESNECALTCLVMLLNFYGDSRTLAKFRAAYGRSYPLSLEELKAVATDVELDSRALRCELDDLSQLRLPAILHFDFDHFVLLERLTSRGAYIVDPASGGRTIPAAELSRRFTGIVLELQPKSDFKLTEQGGDYSVFRLLLRLPFGSLKKPLLLLLAFSICIQCFALSTPFYVQLVVDEVLQVDNESLLTVVTSCFVLIYLLSAVTQWFRGLAVIHISGQLSYSLAAFLMQHLLRLPKTFFDNRQIGDIVSRFSSYKPIQDFVCGSAVSIFIDSIMGLTTLIMLACYSTGIALAVSALLLLFVCLQYLLYGRLRERTHEMIIAEAAAQSHFIETVRMVDTVRRYDAEEYRREEWLNHLVRSINGQVRMSRIHLLHDVMRYTFSGFCILMVVHMATLEIIAMTATVGMLYSIVTYTNHLTGAVLSVTREWQNFLMLSMYVQRLSDITDTQSDDRPVTTTFAVNQLKLSNLAYQFQGAKNILFEEITVEIKKGESLALVGGSGFGKSTLLNVITGSLQPTAGEVTIDGRPLHQEVRDNGLYSSLRQADQLIAGTLIDNIAFCDGSPNLERVVHCAGIAQIHQDILRLPLAYRARVGELGTSLSAGQQQRILIARALYRPSPILVLDEATNHLDESLELEVMREILALPLICIFVTHRPCLAALADHVIHLDASHKGGGNNSLVAVQHAIN